MAAPFHIPTSNIGEIYFLHLFASIWCCHVFILVVLIGGQWYLMVLMCISLMTYCVTLTLLVTQGWLCDSRLQPVLFRCEKLEDLVPLPLFLELPLESDFLCPFVTNQTGAHPCVALMHDPTISVEGNRVLLTGVQPCGGYKHSYSEPCSPWDPTLALFPACL